MVKKKIVDEGEPKPCVLLKDICPQTPKKVVRGEMLDATRTNWLEIENTGVPSGTFLRAGSVVEFTPRQIKELMKFDAVVPEGEKHHFNLEDAFSYKVKYFNEVVPLAEVLRSHSIQTLEQVIDDADGIRPLLDGGKRSGSKIKARQVLRLYCPLDEVPDEKMASWIERAKELIKE